MNPSLPHIEILLPIYNEYANIRPLIKALDAQIQSLESCARITYLFVDDGSSDGSETLLQSLFEQRKDIRVVHLIHNFGHSAAIACGLKYTKGDAVVLMDADLQDSPDALEPLVRAWLSGAKTVVVERGQRKEKMRFLFRAFYFLLHKTSRTMPAINFGTHSLLDRTVISRIQRLHERVRYFPGLVNFTSGKITSIRVNRNARANGKSRVGFFGLIQLAITALVSFSSTPIKFVSLVGLFCALASILSGVSIMGIKLLTEMAIPGWASQMTAIFFASGIQLLCLGIIGEYIARIYDEVKRRPLYIVDELLDHQGKAKKVSPHPKSPPSEPVHAA